jgi:N-acetyl-gamma-glutamylphosphate reductase
LIADSRQAADPRRGSPIEIDPEKPRNAEERRRLIEASTAHRTEQSWVCGPPELNERRRTRIRDAGRVASTGCHAAGFILPLHPLGANDTNRNGIFVFRSDRHMVLISRLDNLGKGAPGAAVPTMNIMLDRDEGAALTA